MKVFLTGASGFIGGSVSSALVAKGHTIRGLVRNSIKAEEVALRGIEPVIGTLDDTELLAHESHQADAVINTASSDHRGAVEAIIDGLKGSGRAFLHTSESSIVGDEVMGEPSERIHAEDEEINPEPDKIDRVAIDRRVLALERADAVTFLYVESGEEELGNIAMAIAERLGLGGAHSISRDEAITIWGREMAVFALGSNSRVRGRIAVEKLGWNPRHRSITDWIRAEMPA